MIKIFIKELNELIINELPKMQESEKQIIFMAALDVYNLELAKKCINYLLTLNFGNDIHSCPLFKAIANNNLNVLKLLIGNNINVNYTSNNTSAIMLSIYYSNFEAFKILYENGANFIIDDAKIIIQNLPSNEIVKNTMLLNIVDYLFDKKKINKTLLYATLITKLSTDKVVILKNNMKQENNSNTEDEINI